ncbi:hypothetical protein I4O85_005050 [Clostridioides difficile]
MSFLKKFKNKRFRNNSFKSNNFEIAVLEVVASSLKCCFKQLLKNKRFKIYAGNSSNHTLILGVLAYVDLKNTELQANENFIETYTIPEMKKYL